MAINRRKKNMVYGIGDNLIILPPEPIVAQRAPTTSDIAQLGSIWLNNAVGGDDIYILREVTANTAAWVACGSGSGTFDSIVSTTTITAGTGFIQLAGTMTITSDTNAADAIYLHADGGTSETIRLHSDQGTGVASVALVSDVGGVTLTSGLASDDAINLAATAGGVDVDAALQVNIASSEAAADAIVLSSSNAAGGIDLTTGGGEITMDTGGTGNIKFTPAANSAAATTVVLNARVGVATFTGQTTAGAAALTLTITNSLVSATSAIIASVSNVGANAALMTVQRILPGVGTFDVVCLNSGIAALNGDVSVSFVVLN